MSVCLVIKTLAQGGGVDEVAVVGHADAIRAVNVERLCFRVGAAAGGGVAKVTKAHVARQVSDTGSVLEDLGGHAVALALVETTTRAAAHDTSRILATVLEQVQRIVDLDGCRSRLGISVDHSDDSTHGEECVVLGTVKSGIF